MYKKITAEAEKQVRIKTHPYALKKKMVPITFFKDKEGENLKEEKGRKS